MNRRIVRLGLVAVAAAAVIAIGLSLRPASNSGAKAASVARPASSPSPSQAVGATFPKLAYGLNDGDIYLANWDGSDPVRIVNGTSRSKPGNPAWGEGPTWSPDGRYLVYGRETGKGRIVFISDARGHLLGSFSQEGSDVAWSPDSTRVAAWVRWGRTIGIFNLHGVREQLLTVSSSGDTGPVWSPDGASLVVRQGIDIPLNGGTPTQLPASDPRSHWPFWLSPDGSRVAYLDGPQGWLEVAAADGSGSRVLVRGRVDNAVWSPSGDQIAFDTQTSIGLTQIIGPSGEVGVVDVASGKLTTLIAVGAHDTGQVMGFSPDGTLVLFSSANAKNVSSLWAVRTDGSRPMHLVSGTGGGGWQPRR